VCGVLSFALSIFLGIFLGPVAILLGLQALREYKQKPFLEGAAFARWGIGLGIVGIVSFVILLITLKPLMRS
jgi:hypothetical protein